MKVAGTQLEQITMAQSQSLQAWENSSTAIQGAVQGLQNAAEQISGFAEEMREASEPTVRADLVRNPFRNSQRRGIGNPKFVTIIWPPQVIQHCEALTAPRGKSDVSF